MIMNIYEENVEQLRVICDLLGINESIFRFMSKPARTTITNFPVKMDIGSVDMYQGYRVLHSNVLGPGKGGIQYSPDLTLDDVKTGAMLMTWKSSLIGLPLGGAKGGVIVDPKLLSRRELEVLTRRYTTSIMNVIGPAQDIPSPDLGTDSQTMAWMMDQYSTGIGKTTPGVVTGKPVEIGGTLGRDMAVGWGLATILKDFSQKEGEEIRDKKIVIQGIGHVGKNIAQTAAGFGAKVIAISDSSTGIYNSDGLDVNDLIQYKETTGSLKGYPRGDEIVNDDMLALECDALLPCATSNEINKEIAEKLQCRVIIEGANHPITFDGDQVINERDITVIPDVIANAGGLIVSYIEFVQDISALHWNIERVMKELDRIILSAFETIVQTKHEKGVTYRQAALMVAVKRVSTAIMYRGIFP
jgi:glutamate dehydrogenase (NAD(P)+)